MAGSLSQYKPAVRCLYNWVCVSVQTVQLGCSLCKNRRFGAFTTGFVSQYKPYNWVVVSVKTGGSVPLQLGLYLSTNRTTGL